MRNGGAWLIALLLGGFCARPAGSETAPVPAPAPGAPGDEDPVKRIAERTGRIRALLDGIERVCTHPKEDPAKRRTDLLNGMTNLGF